MRTIATLALLLLSATACDKAAEKSPAASTGSAGPASAAATAAADDGEGIPTEEDFEDEAEQKISTQNVEDELDKLEKEISN